VSQMARKLLAPRVGLEPTTLRLTALSLSLLVSTSSLCCHRHRSIKAYSSLPVLPRVFGPALLKYPLKCSTSSFNAPTGITLVDDRNHVIGIYLEFAYLLRLDVARKYVSCNGTVT
jgi:hypothetical protein